VTVATPTETDPRAILRHRFGTMGVTVELLLESDMQDEGRRALEAVEREFRRLDAIFSRFDAGSELSRLNRLGTLRCGPELAEVVDVALRAREATSGRFDPTVHDALVEAGYDRTFRDLRDDVCDPIRLPRPCGGDVRVDPASRIVRLGPDTRIDLGGIVKGYAAERACDLLEELGPCLANAAGDIALRGVPAAGPWTVQVDTPDAPLVLALSRGGLATSGRDYRRWRRNGQELHHLIDPSTGAPSTSDLLTVTVIASDAVEAEVHAKALFLAGESAAVTEAERLGLPCLLVTGDARVVRAGGLA
jgi:thiamine biosynthesis lipoprotein